MTLAYNPGKADLIASFGFRHYARNFAASVGVTGFIQRMRYMDVKLVIEGTQTEIRQFETWLHTCHGQGMFRQMVPKIAQRIAWRSFPNFTIHLDFTRPHHLQARPDGIRGRTTVTKNYPNILQFFIKAVIIETVVMKEAVTETVTEAVRQRKKQR
mmetsp:Transcript_4965/g.6851  ORF Transcript_4965/g.6851 Transcript_4965/m.6851 type:complete len:156 (+) Transcript_4965:396-863(+)